MMVQDVWFFFYLFTADKVLIKDTPKFQVLDYKLKAHKHDHGQAVSEMCINK